jgi:RNA polymerase sigma factor (sigma-70 family)
MGMADLKGVIAAYGPGISRLAASYERDRALREELVQEILLAIHQALPRLEDQAKLRPFVFRIAHNRAVSHVAARVREPKSDEVPETMAADEPSPEHTTAARQNAARLQQAVRRLPLPYRQVITLVLEDMSHDEIAESLGLTVTNVGVRVNRAKTQLKAMLSDE